MKIYESFINGISVLVQALAASKANTVGYRLHVWKVLIVGLGLLMKLRMKL